MEEWLDAGGRSDLPRRVWREWLICRACGQPHVYWFYDWPEKEPEKWGFRCVSGIPWRR